jgi:hypothetical protein
MQQDLYLPFGHVYASNGLGDGVGEAEAEAEAEAEEGEMRALDIEGVGDGFSCATGMAVTARIVVRPVKMVVRYIVAVVLLDGCCLYGRERLEVGSPRRVARTWISEGVMQAIKECFGPQIETEMNDWSWAWLLLGCRMGVRRVDGGGKEVWRWLSTLKLKLPASQHGNRAIAFPVSFLLPWALLVGWLVDPGIPGISSLVWKGTLWP